MGVRLTLVFRGDLSWAGADRSFLRVPLSYYSATNHFKVNMKPTETEATQALPPPPLRGLEPCWSGSPSSLHRREPANDAGTSLIAVLCRGQIPMDPQSNDPSQSDKQDILCLCFSPSEETLLVSTSKNQLYSITMSLTEISKASLSQQCFCPDFSHLSS